LITCSVHAAYAPRPGAAAPRYTSQQALDRLGRAATGMNAANTRELAWWHLVDRATGPRSRPALVIRGGLPVCLVSALLFALANGLFGGITNGYADGLTSGVAGALVCGAATAIEARIRNPAVDAEPGPPPPRRPRPRLLLEGAAARGAAAGLLLALVLGFGLVGESWGGVALGLTAGLAVALVPRDRPGAGRDAKPTDRLITPSASWHGARRFAQLHILVSALAAGLTIGMATGLALGMAGGFDGPLAAGTAAGLAAGVLIKPDFADRSRADQQWPAAALAPTLRRRSHGPLHAMSVFEDARERGILRGVGPVYQFRHARVQDHLAGTAANGPL
jgi:hypothetical protein